MSRNGPNRLAGEKSPYLLQHAHNPVDWYPWGEEAFARAHGENRPVFLSIGYSTCHWCHVMERESFEDAGVAALMNRAFVCIKVDREERPDIDHVYMTACQMMTGSGGWPLTILMTPDGRPFFAATYIPRAAMLTFVPRVEQAWRDDADALVADAERVTEALRRAMDLARGDEIGEDVLRSAFRQFSSRFDETHGGFGDRPKFPTPHNLVFLLRWWKRSGEALALEMVEKTLDRMRRGGVYDQVGFGLHRYSTDARWHLPHFEKMLYDQALLVLALTEAHAASGRASIRETALEVCDYVMRDLSSPEGGFYAAEDADSEGEEGKFYVWTRPELDAVLGPDAAFAAACFGAREEGNFEDEASGHRSGANVLFLPRSYEELAASQGSDAAGLRARLDSVRARLLEARSRRVRPHLDDKVLTDWNGLMIAALARAGRVLARPDLTARAVRAAEFVHERLAGEGGSLLHRWRDGEAAVAGMLDDYAFLGWGLLELYEATFDERFLERAIAHARRMRANFEDPEGGFFMSAAGAHTAAVRPREVYDGATPSGNSAATLVLARLGRMTGLAEFEDRARAACRAFSGQVASLPMGHAHMLSAADFLLGPGVEVVLAGRRGAADVERMRRLVDERFLPNAVVVFRPEGDAGAIMRLAPFLREQSSRDGVATAYVCRNHACDRPTTDAAELARVLDA